MRSSGLEFGVGLGGGDEAPLRVEGVLPPDLQGTFVRIGPSGAGGGALHAVELREGQAVSYVARESAADANVFWHARSLLALPEAGVPRQYSRELEEEEFGAALTIGVASHVKLDAARGRRVLFGVEQGAESTTLRLGEWAAGGSLVSAQSVELERATWQHDVGVTASSLVFIESPTEPLGGDAGDEVAVPFGWVPGSEGWLGVVRREDALGAVAEPQWLKVDPCLVTHVLGAFDEDDGVVLWVVVYPAPEVGQPGVALGTSVVGPEGIGRSLIGGGLGVLERWTVRGGRLERVVVDERFVEYPRVDSTLEGAPLRYGYGVELGAAGDAVEALGLLKFDFARDEVAAWSPGAGAGSGLVASEPVFVRAVDGRSDEEGWLLTVVDEAGRGGSDLWVLDASSMGGRRRSVGHAQAVVHLPDGVRLPFRSHGEWVGAEKYR